MKFSLLLASIFIFSLNAWSKENACVPLLRQLKTEAKPPVEFCSNNQGIRITDLKDGYASKFYLRQFVRPIGEGKYSQFFCQFQGDCEGKNAHKNWQNFAFVEYSGIGQPRIPLFKYQFSCDERSCTYDGAQCVQSSPFSLPAQLAIFWKDSWSEKEDVYRSRALTLEKIRGLTDGKQCANLGDNTFVDRELLRALFFDAFSGRKSASECLLTIKNKILAHQPPVTLVGRDQSGEASADVDLDAAYKQLDRYLSLCKSVANPSPIQLTEFENPVPPFVATFARAFRGYFVANIVGVKKKSGWGNFFQLPQRNLEVRWPMNLAIQTDEGRNGSEFFDRSKVVYPSFDHLVPVILYYDGKVIGNAQAQTLHDPKKIILKDMSVPLSKLEHIWDQDGFISVTNRERLEDPDHWHRVALPKEIKAAAAKFLIKKIPKRSECVRKAGSLPAMVKSEKTYTENDMIYASRGFFSDVRKAYYLGVSFGSAEIAKKCSDPDSVDWRTEEFQQHWLIVTEHLNVRENYPDATPKDAADYFETGKSQWILKGESPFIADPFLKPTN